MQQQPVRKHPQAPYIVAVVVALFIGYGVGYAAHGDSATAPGAQSQQATATSTATDTPIPVVATDTPAASWTTTHTFSGNGAKKTAIFTVGSDWRLSYTCTPGQFEGVLQVTIYDNTGNIVDIALNTTCKAGQTSKDTTELHSGGSMYLDINATGDWTLAVSELK